MIKGIVYTSETGHSKEYAELLGKQTGLKVFPLDDVDLEKGSQIIYFGWICAGKIKGFDKAAKNYEVKAVCGVGMGPASKVLEEKISKTLKNKTIAFFYLQGGLQLQKLSGLNKFIMILVSKSIRKSIEAKNSLLEDDKLILKMVNEGASVVKESSLSSIMDWYTKNNR
ncbi:MAG: flavodoxin domain-containing protein [Treponemataceae bacterium]